MLRLVFSMRRGAKFLVFFSVCSMVVIGVSWVLASLPTSVTTSELLGLTFFIMFLLAYLVDRGISMVLPEVKPRSKFYT